MTSIERHDVILEEILFLLRLALRPQIKKYLESVFPSKNERIAFQNSDGRTSRKIADTCGLGKTKVGSLWKEWFKQGLGEMADTKGGGSRFVRSISLDDFGLELT